MQLDSQTPKLRKHPCPDCKMCQSCSESRCRACRNGRDGKRACKLSIQEQIALFNSLNPGLCSPGEAGCTCKGTD